MEPFITVSLFHEAKKISSCQLPVSDFAGSDSVNKKCYYEAMAGPAHSAFLRATIGIAQDFPDPVEVKNIPLVYHKGVFVPPPEFRSSQPLPDEWLENIPNVKRYD